MIIQYNSLRCIPYEMIFISFICIMGSLLQISIRLILNRIIIRSNTRHFCLRNFWFLTRAHTHSLFINFLYTLNHLFLFFWYFFDLANAIYVYNLFFFQIPFFRTIYQTKIDRNECWVTIMETINRRNGSSTYKNGKN